MSITPSTELVPLAPLQQALALATEAGDIGKLRDIASMATALQSGAKARGMGVEAENQAAEVVLRAERAIGLVLIDMRAAGELAGPGQYQSGVGPRAHKSGPPSIAQVLDVDPQSWTVRQAFDWQSLARIPVERFERMLSDVRGSAERIAKVNFYRPVKDKHDLLTVDGAAAAATPEDPNFVSFRRGAYGLLGWTEGEPTRNGLSNLPDDELRQFAVIVKHLVAAYNETKAARG